MIRLIRCKMRCVFNRQEGPYRRVRLDAIFEDGANKEWSEVTPTGFVELVLERPEVFGQFEPNKFYYMDFDEAPEHESVPNDFQPAATTRKTRLTVEQLREQRERDAAAAGFPVGEEVPRHGHSRTNEAGDVEFFDAHDMEWISEDDWDEPEAPEDGDEKTDGGGKVWRWSESAYGWVLQV